MSGFRVEIENLSEFQGDLQRAIRDTARELSQALERGGRPLIDQIKANAPKKSGRLAASYRLEVNGNEANIVNDAPYGGGAEWGARGKWSGFNRYGGPGRFAAEVLESQSDRLSEDVSRELDDILTAHGWAT